MKKHNEQTRVQIPAIIHLVKLGYTYFSLKDTTNFQLDQETNIMKTIFAQRFLELNPETTKEDFEREYTNISLELAQDDLGKSFYKRLINKGNSLDKLIDWEDFSRNSFHVACEVTCQNGEEEFRPDITIFINGLPLSYIEVKQPNILRNGLTGMKSEFERTERRFANQKFRKFHNITQLICFSDNLPYDETKGLQIQGSYYATPSKKTPKFNAFREERKSEIAEEVKTITDTKINEILRDNNNPMLKHSPEFRTNSDEYSPLNAFLTSLYSKNRLKMFLRYGIAYINGEKGIEKHIMRYPQFFATKAIEQNINEGMKKGVIWHTQGSGKTALAYFNVRYLTDKLSKQGKIPRFYFIVDRLDLATQAHEEFVKRGLRSKIITDKNELDKPHDSEITVVNIHKFKNDTNFTNQTGYDLNIQNIYFIDEAHRSYNPSGSYLANLYQTDEQAIKIALTGTPLIVYGKHDKDDEELSEKKDVKTTRNIFGEYIHKYYYNQSIADGYTLRLMREEIQKSHKEALTGALESLQVQEKSLNKKMLHAHPKFVQPMLGYILEDLENIRIRFNDKSLGAMVVADSSEQARELFRQFQQRKTSIVSFPTLNHSTGESFPLAAEEDITYEYGEGLKAALILYDENDKETRNAQIKAFKDGEIDVLFVYSMLLTGFDANRLKKLYLGRKIKAHNLLQTLTRVNRPYKEYTKGYVVDFADISKEFDETNRAYFEELNREYQAEDAGVSPENVFGSLFVPAKEITAEVEEARRVLLDYSTDNLELFDQEITAVNDRKTLIELKKTLANVRENYNLARLLGHVEVTQAIDIRDISQLFYLVERRLKTMSVLEQAGDTNAEELLNIAMNETEFFFTKIGEEELNLAANDAQEITRKAACEIQSNWDKKDPEWLSLYEEFQRLLKNYHIKEQANIEDYQHLSKEFTRIYNEMRELNRKDRQLANQFNGDKKYARTFKRMTNSGKISDNAGLYQMMSKAKQDIDTRVMNNQGILQNLGYFANETRQISLEALEHSGKTISPKLVVQFSTLLSDEYVGAL